MKGKPRIAVIKWEDAAYYTDYYIEADPHTYATLIVSTVGFIVKRERTRIVLAADAYEDGAKRHITTIPRRYIKKITYLRGID